MQKETQRRWDFRGWKHQSAFKIDWMLSNPSPKPSLITLPFIGLMFFWPAAATFPFLPIKTFGPPWPWATLFLAYNRDKRAVTTQNRHQPWEKKKFRPCGESNKGECRVFSGGKQNRNQWAENHQDARNGRLKRNLDLEKSKISQTQKWSPKVLIGRKKGLKRKEWVEGGEKNTIQSVSDPTHVPLCLTVQWVIYGERCQVL